MHLFIFPDLQLAGEYDSTTVNSTGYCEDAELEDEVKHIIFDLLGIYNMLNDCLTGAYGTIFGPHLCGIGFGKPIL